MEEKQKEFDSLIKKLIYSNLITIIMTSLIFVCTNYFLYKDIYVSLYKFSILIEILIYSITSIIIGLVVKKIFNLNKRKLNEFRNYNINSLAKDAITYLKEEYNEIFVASENKINDFTKKFYDERINVFQKFMQKTKIRYYNGLAFLSNTLPMSELKELSCKSTKIKMNKIGIYKTYNCFNLIAAWGLVISVILSLILNFACNSYIASIICSSLFIIFCSILSSGIGYLRIKICKHCGVIDMDYLSDNEHYSNTDLNEVIHDVYGTANIYNNSGNKIGSVKAKVGTESTFQEVTTYHIRTEYSCLCCGKLMYTEHRTY